MSSHRRGRPRLFAVLLALCFIPGLGFIASLSWLKTQPDNVVLLVSGIAGAVTITASLLLAALHDRSLGEWERSNARFSGHWGEAAGTAVVALSLIIPAVRDGMISLVAGWAGVTAPDQKPIIIAFVLGFMATVIARVVCMALISTGWAIWKSRPAQDA